MRTLEITQLELSPEYIEILQDEINVREIKLSAKNMKLDTVIDDELIAAGQVREIIRSINNLRKASGLTIQDQAILHIEADKYIIDLINKASDEIKFATLMREVIFSKIETEYSQEFDLGEHHFWLGIIK